MPVPLFGHVLLIDSQGMQSCECILLNYPSLFVRDADTLQKNGMGNKKLIIGDHNRDLLYQRARTVLEDPEAAKYVWE